MIERFEVEMKAALVYIQNREEPLGPQPTA
jgi:hypothetical protein